MLGEQVEGPEGPVEYPEGPEGHRQELLTPGKTVVRLEGPTGLGGPVQPLGAVGMVSREQGLVFHPVSRSLGAPVEPAEAIGRVGEMDLLTGTRRLQFVRFALYDRCHMGKEPIPICREPSECMIRCLKVLGMKPRLLCLRLCSLCSIYPIQRMCLLDSRRFGCP